MKKVLFLIFIAIIYFNCAREMVIVENLSELYDYKINTNQITKIDTSRTQYDHTKIYKVYYSP